MTRLALAVVCAAAAVLLAAPAHAADQDYTLRVVEGDPGESRVATLSCGPAGGSHPDAAAACAQIREAGSIEEVKADPGPCPMVYRPVTAIAEGSESYGKEFPNSCVLTSEKGAVFAF
ncbi:subtilisin inhibitor-like [Murinocardiopsis flavida]|uniref:Subtilisin inhibitor-like n=1 Tax=Murinocardiopsis flavida TaxID=645275 RepID=A0A2P8DF62_9ACTN|nr:SSI family serine proteinase inhibitor [Murinocardiopsis flavida]PSK95853.1 subtilisin inhibitor-like [Murinocardiopsis flavida]